MTLAQILTIINSLTTALTTMNMAMPTHSIGDASYDWTSHMEQLQKQLEYWNNLYNTRQGAGKVIRMGTKAV